MKKLILLLSVVLCACAHEPTEDELDAIRHKEIRAAIDPQDSIICSTFGLADTIKYCK